MISPVEEKRNETTTSKYVKEIDEWVSADDTRTNQTFFFISDGRRKSICDLQQ